MFELTDAVLCADGPVRSLPELSLVGEHRRGHGSVYAALDRGRIEIARLRRATPLLASGDDAATVTAAQLRTVIADLIDAGHRGPGDPDIWVVTDSGYDSPRLAFPPAICPWQCLAGCVRTGSRAAPRRHECPAPTVARPGTVVSSPSVTRPPWASPQ
ncbi:hypothetical protein APR08_001720 [Nocardia amikacinitolerans]|nr:hypothetical protein [Nocardia amikacinitolerans]